MRRRSRAERTRSRAEWRRRWRSVPYAEQKRVREALQRGAAVDHPALAPLAVEAAEHPLHGDDGYSFARYRGAISAAQGVLAAAALVAGIVAGDVLRIAFGACLGALVGADVVVRRVERRRLERAAAANRAVGDERTAAPA